MMGDCCHISMTDDGKYILDFTKDIKGGKNELSVSQTKSVKVVADDIDELIDLIKEHMPVKKSDKEKNKEEFKKGWDKAEE